MNTKDIVDIDAFSKGLQKSTMSLGLILPVAATKYIFMQAMGMIPGQYGAMVMNAVSDIVMFNIMSSH